MKYVFKVFDSSFPFNLKNSIDFFPIRPARWIVEKEYFKPIQKEDVKKIIDSAKDDLDKFFELFEKESETNVEAVVQKPETATMPLTTEQEITNIKKDIDDIKQLLLQVLSKKE